MQSLPEMDRIKFMFICLRWIDFVHLDAKGREAGTTCKSQALEMHCKLERQPLFCGHALSLPLNIRKHRAWTGTDERFVVVFADLEDRI